MKTKKLIILLFLSAIHAGFLSAQEKMVEGYISKGKKPVPDVSVSTSNTYPVTSDTFSEITVTSKTVTTNKKGYFNIKNVPSLKDTLILKLTSENILRIPLEGTNYVIVQLEDDTTHIYKETKTYIHPQYGGTVVTKKELDQTSERNLLKAIAMRVAGVEYRGGNLIIRGISSIKLDSNPLYVIDGVQTYDASYLTVWEVKSVEVLKDASSTAIFGVKGTNGVVIINLK